MRKLLAGQEPPANFHFACEWPAGIAGIEYLDEYLGGHPATKLVNIDPWGRMRGEPTGRHSAYQQDYRDLGPFHALANRHKVAILLITHTRKMEATDIFNRVSGTTGVQGMADAMWVLTRDRGQLLAELAVTGRDIENDGAFAVRFAKETGRWTLVGEAQRVKRETEQDRVYQFLLVQKEPVSVQDIVDALPGMNRNTVKSTLQRLQKRGSVENTGKKAWRATGGREA